MTQENLARKFTREITPMPGEKLTAEQAAEATEKLNRGEVQPETTGKLKFDLESVKAKIISLRGVQSKERIEIANNKNMDIKEKSRVLMEFDDKAKSDLQPLIAQRDDMERRLGGGHA